MGNFTTDWDESTVADTAQASTLGAVDRANQVDLSDRLKALIYGFIAGENDGVPGCKNLALKQQAGDPTVATDTITLYAKDVGGNNEVFAKDEAGNVVQITSAGTIGAGGLALLAGKDLILSSTSDIAVDTNKFTVAGATGNTVIAGTLGVTGVATLGDGSILAAATEVGDGARTIVDKAYVDLSAYTNEDSDSSTLLISISGGTVHAYKAATDGYVVGYINLGAGEFLNLYVGLTDDPVGEGGISLIESTLSAGASASSVSGLVAKDEYFEFLTDSSNSQHIRWKSIGTLVKPTDQD